MLHKTAKTVLPLLMLLAALFSTGALRVAAEEIELPDDEPSYAEPSFDDEPSYDEPSYDEPSYIEPTYEVPDFTEPAATYAPDWTVGVPVETPEPATDNGAAGYNNGYSDNNGGDNGGDNGDGQYTPPVNAQDAYLDPDKAANDAQTNNSVKMDKSVSDKTYSTDYTAGVVSWICVGVGVVVIIVMIASTKIHGARMSRRRI